jgi:hypothetical protein
MIGSLALSHCTGPTALTLEIRRSGDPKFIFWEKRKPKDENPRVLASDLRIFGSPREAGSVRRGCSAAGLRSSVGRLALSHCTGPTALTLEIRRSGDPKFIFGKNENRKTKTQESWLRIFGSSDLPAKRGSVRRCLALSQLHGADGSLTLEIRRSGDPKFILGNTKTEKRKPKSLGFGSSDLRICPAKRDP